MRKSREEAFGTPIPATSHLGSLSASDLLDRYESLAGQRSHFRDIIKNLARPPTKRETAAFLSAQESLTKCREELAIRLGILMSPEVTNRKSFLWLGAQLRKARCDKCGSKTYYAKGLEFWSQDETKPVPLLRMMAFGGATVPKLEDALMLVNCLCSQCAKKKGAVLTQHGKPYLPHYGIVP